jgi:hypothetical protein
MPQDRRKLVVRLPGEVYDLVAGYAAGKGISLEEAIAELLRKGYEYSDLEKKYDKSVHDREVWDRRYYFLEIESAYLYYKLRSSEIYEDAKALAMTLSSVVSALEHMAQRCGFSDGNMAEYLSRLRSTARHYMDKYVLASRREEDAPEVSDAEVLRSIEETLEKYKRTLLRSSVGG